MRFSIGLLFFILFFVGAGARFVGASEPTDGPYSYHQLRTLSGLSGSTYGVDENGYLSLAGPVAFSTPVANTLGHGRWWVGGGQYSFSSAPIFAAATGNWNYFLTYGFTVGKFNISATANVVDTNFETLANLQIQYIPPKSSKWTFSLGTEDLFDVSKTENYNFTFPNRESSFSFFGVATYRTILGRYPLYLSGGWGMRRFGAGFQSLSMQIARPWRLWAEQDGFGINAGALYTTKIGQGKKGLPFTVLAGAAKGHYFLFALGIGH